MRTSAFNERAREGSDIKILFIDNCQMAHNVHEVCGLTRISHQFRRCHIQSFLQLIIVIYINC